MSWLDGPYGHIARLIPPAYVKPFVKRQKNDASDAEAICEAAQRPTMRFVAVKSETAQANAVCSRRAISWSDNGTRHQRSSRTSWRVWFGRG